MSRQAKRRPTPHGTKTPNRHAVEITSFRLSVEQQSKLKERLPAGLVDGDSHHLLARKIVRDFIDGNLVYLTSQARLCSRVAS